MFYFCENLKELDLSAFNTANATDMSGMFSCCEKLKSLDLSSFDTKKVTSMASMFSSCTSLKTIFVSDKWNTSSVKNYESIFNLDKKLYGGKGTRFPEKNKKIRNTMKPNSIFRHVKHKRQSGYKEMFQ
jgi:surface protein